MQHKTKSHQGFTLVELIAVVAVLTILAGILIPSIVGFVERARLAADQATVRVLNSLTALFRQSVKDHDPFGDTSIHSDELMQDLVADGYLVEAAAPQTKSSFFGWDFNKQVWLLFVDDTPIALSPLGSSFEEISTGMIELILKRLNSTGKYGRNWGEYSYTDIGLDPNDWKEPIQHIYFKPGGSNLRIRPEDGYMVVVEDVFGVQRKLYTTYKWDLVYSDLDKKWYYHSISKENEIDIDSLQVSRIP